MKKLLFLFIGSSCIVGIILAAPTIGGPTLSPISGSTAAPTNVNLTAFNPNQFDTNAAGRVQIKSGATETNKQIYSGVTLNSGVYTGDANGQTNISGLGFSSGGTPSAASVTNYTITIGSIYQSITLTTNFNLIAVSGLGSASVKLLPGGGNRTISFDTNFCFLNTNGLILVGSLYSITLTNAASHIGWVSVQNSGTDKTNVTITYQQTP